MQAVTVYCTVADPNLKVCVKVLLPAVMVLRYSDDIRGGSLDLMYNLLLQLDAIYSSAIQGLPDTSRTKVSLRCSGLFKQ